MKATAWVRKGQRRFPLRLLLCWVFCSIALAQPPVKLTLKEAEEVALKNHPQIQASLLNALAANEVPTEVRAIKYPLLSVNVTGAGANDNARITAGALNNPTILSRGATGLSVNQLVYDFGRTNELIEAAHLRAQAADQYVQATREQIIFQVDRAYFNTLKAQAVLRVAEQTVKARALVVEQVEALKQSGLKSGLDVSFVNYNLAEAKLLLARSQNDVKAAYAELSTALGSQEEQTYELAEESSPAALPQTDLVNEALQKRPDLSALQFEVNAAHRFWDAEKKLGKPSVSAIWSVGVTPFGDSRLSKYYNAIGVNVSIPILNGHLFTARAAEAAFRARATEQVLKVAENQVARDVRVAQLNVNTAFQRLGLAAQLLLRAQESQDLAQERYRLGLSSIVEFNQSQLNVTIAEIENANARYDYLIQRAVLRYQTTSH